MTDAPKIWEIVKHDPGECFTFIYKETGLMINEARVKPK
jgi:hypothetical protein